MKSTANHIIHKQTLEVRFRDFTSAQKWDASNQVKTTEAVRKSIEQCFEAYDSAKEYLTIDRLELDLGTFSTGQLLSKMPENLYLELQKILRTYLVEMTHFGDAEIIEETSSGNFSVPQVTKRKTNLIVKNSEVTAFLFFLQYGYLPWWYSNEPAWDPEWVQKLTGENLQELRNFLTAYEGNEVYYERALLRLISQFNDGFLANLLNGLQLKEPVEKAWSWLARFYISMQKIETDFHHTGSLPSLSILRKHFWKKWIEYALGRSAIPGLTSLLAPIQQPSLITSFLLGVVKRNELMDSIPGFWRNELISFKHAEYNGKPGSGINAELINYTESAKFNETEKVIPISVDDFIQVEYDGKAGSGINVELNNYSEIKKFKETEKANSIPKDDFILIPGAGLVLLHPFLQRLFEHCHWLDENEFVNDVARNRAVYLLHYLAAGNEDAPEYVLMLPKLLCGIPPEWPLEPALPLTDAEKAACNEMLIQVIAHWTALRDTSPAGLREAFLWRQGKLFLSDEGWRLEVQYKTEDILLNHLPWGFSMIKFSWMPRLLSVSWE